MNTQQLVDSYGRSIDYLRISVTDLCNFRCVYCTPQSGLQTLATSLYLSRQEVLRFVRVACRLGITRIRLTGGEPLLRKDIVEIVRDIRSVEGVTDLSITTNGSHLTPLLAPLKEAGLDRLNISLDSMDKIRFEEVTRSPSYDKVLATIHAALQAGFPVKLNMVVLQGLTAKEIIAYVNLALNFPLEVRFLEFMPLCGSEWKQELVLPIQNVRAIVNENFDLEPLPRNREVAETYQVKNGEGRVGFIASLSESFCDDCSRMRLSADGNIQPCLFSDKTVSVKTLLRDNASDEKIEDAIRLAALIKPRGNWFRDHPFSEQETVNAELAQGPMIRFIGG